MLKYAESSDVCKTPPLVESNALLWEKQCFIWSYIFCIRKTKPIYTTYSLYVEICMHIVMHVKLLKVFKNMWQEFFSAYEKNLYQTIALEIWERISYIHYFDPCVSNVLISCSRAFSDTLSWKIALFSIQIGIILHKISTAFCTPSWQMRMFRREILMRHIKGR